MAKISENELARIVNGIVEDRSVIIKHNPIGSDDEVLLWMLLNCLSSYLSLADDEMPCFPSSVPDADTYREAIRFVLRGRTEPTFDPEPYLDKLVQA